MPRTQAPPSRQQTLLSLAVMAVLAMVALGVWLKQARYDPLAWGVPTPVKGQAALAQAATGGPLDLASLAPPGLGPMGPPEAFDQASLSDKIDGKAELYLAAGFRQLATRRFQLNADPKLWLEAYVFAMDQPRGAFSVFSVQRRSGAQALDLTPNAYQTANAVFLAQGPFYLEIVASAAQPELVAAAQGLARAWLARVPREQAGVQDERALLPSEGLNQESVALLASDVFGFDRLNQTYVGTYTLGQEEASAFISRRQDAAQAEELDRAYVEFLLANGGREVKLGVAIDGARLVDLLGSFELVFTRGNLLAGVHQAESQAAAETLGLRLAQALQGGQP